jgi:hypothetical protein
LLAAFDLVAGAPVCARIRHALLKRVSMTSGSLRRFKVPPGNRGKKPMLAHRALMFRYSRR